MADQYVLEKLDKLEKTTNSLASALRKIGGKVQSFAQWPHALLPIEKNIKAVGADQAEWYVPRYYTVSFDLAEATTAESINSVTVNQEGWFILQRIRAAWFVTAGANTGRFCGLSSDNPFIVGSTAGGAAHPIDILDFEWQYSEGRAQRKRMEQPLPGSLLFRSDVDGFVPEGDMFGPNATIQVTITPLRAVEHAGTLHMIFSGTQCLNVLKQ